MRTLWLPLILLLPGCTFFSFGPDGVNPRRQLDATPGLYIVFAVFVIILLAAVFVALFKETKPGPQGDGDKCFAVLVAAIAAVVVLVLTG